MSAGLENAYHILKSHKDTRYGADVHNGFDKNMILPARTHIFQSAHLYFKSFLRTINTLKTKET